MTPIAFDGCFGWFHPGGRARGVVLCGPVGEEADYVHGAWRELAEQLARGGLSTLRFDYPGLGASLDLAQRRDASTAWVESIKSAIDWLKTEAAIDDVAVVGMRLGAGLALRCARETGGVSRLVLIAPVVSGAAFQRELALTAMLSSAADSSANERARSVAASVFTAEQTFDVGNLRFSQDGQNPARQVLILSTASGDPCALGARLAALGAEVTQEAFPGYAALMVQPDGALYPEVAFGKVVDWLRDGSRPSAAPSIPGALRGPLTAALRPPGALETPVVFRDDAPLFGVLCRPDTPRKGRPGIIFMNTEAVAQAGTNRIWVSMARRFAADGFTSLRFDISGVGDSPGRTETAGRRPVMKEACADVGSAIGWLQTQGCSTITLVGFCWGAQLACNVALEDDRIARLILINSPRHFWDLETDKEPPRSLNTYLRRFLDFAKWSSLLRGKISLVELAQFVGRLIFLTLKSIYRWAAGAEDLSAKAIQRLRSLHTRGVQTGFFHGDDDTFLREIEDYLRVDRHQLAELLSIHTHFFPNVHHRFADDRSLAGLVQAVGDYLSRVAGGMEAAAWPGLGQVGAAREASRARLHNRKAEQHA